MTETLSPLRKAAIAYGKALSWRNRQAKELADFISWRPTTTASDALEARIARQRVKLASAEAALAAADADLYAVARTL